MVGVRVALVFSLLKKVLSQEAGTSNESSLILDRACVRGVEIAPTGSGDELLLRELTSCRVASLLVLAIENQKAATKPPLDEAACAAVLKADALLVRRGLDVSVAALYGQLLRGAANVIVPVDAVDTNAKRRVMLDAGFLETNASSGYSRFVPRRLLPLGLDIVSPKDGEVFAFGQTTALTGSATIHLRVRVPPDSLLVLLPSPALRVAADPMGANPLIVPLPWRPDDAGTKSDRAVDLTLNNVPAGSHLITASLAFGGADRAHRVVPDASASTMIDVVPKELLERQPVKNSLGCARAATRISSNLEHGPVLNDKLRLWSRNFDTLVDGASVARPSLRIALIDLVPSPIVDGQRRVWIQRCKHWAREQADAMAHSPRFEVTYLLLYDDFVPPLSSEAPVRRAIDETGVRASAVAAPWHVGHSSGSALQQASEAAGRAVETALSCARFDVTAIADLTGAQRAWVSFLNKSIDVVFMHAAPGVGGPVGDAARLSCLGRLSHMAGVATTLVELPTVPSAELLTWRGAAPPNYARRHRYNEVTINGGALDMSVSSWADALIVPSHYAVSLECLLSSAREKYAQAMATARAIEHGRGDGSVATSKTPVVVLQPGVGDQWFRAGEQRRISPSPQSRRKQVAVWVGRLDADKSPLLFVRACAILASDDVETECVVVGDGPLRAPLAARAAALARRPTIRHSVGADNVTETVVESASVTTRFVGARHDNDGLAEVVASADVLVSTSVYPETFGLVPLEAAAAGVAVIAFGVAGMAEHVCDGLNAIVPAAPTPAALADAMRHLLDDRSRASALGAAGAESAAKHFGSKAAADRVAEFVARTHSVLTAHDARCRIAERGTNLTSSCSSGRPILSPIYDENSFLLDVAAADSWSYGPSL